MNISRESTHLSCKQVDAVVEVIYRTAMWQERRQLSPEWGAVVQAVLQVVPHCVQGNVNKHNPAQQYTTGLIL